MLEILVHVLPILSKSCSYQGSRCRVGNHDEVMMSTGKVDVMLTKSFANESYVHAS